MIAQTTVTEELTPLKIARTPCSRSTFQLQQETIKPLATTRVEDPFRLLRLRRDAVLRPPDWRWQLAQHLVRGGVRPPWKIDRPTRIAARFLRWLDKCQDDRDRLLLQQKMPAMWSAHDLHTGEPSGVRDELQARLLTGDSPDAIAEKMNLPVGVVLTYERYFFQVSDRITNPTWITHLAIGPKLHQGLSEEDQGVLWKHFAFWGGTIVLDALLFDREEQRKPQHPSEVADYFREHIAATLRRKTAIAMRMLRPEDPKTGIKLARLMLRLSEIELRRRDRHGSCPDVTPNVEAALGMLDRAWRLRDAPWHLQLAAPNAGDRPAYLPEGVITAPLVTVVQRG